MKPVLMNSSLSLNKASIISVKRLIVTPMRDKKGKKTQIHRVESAKEGLHENVDPQSKNIDDISDIDKIIKMDDLEGTLLEDQNKKNIFEDSSISAFTGRKWSNSRRKKTSIEINHFTPTKNIQFIALLYISF